MSKWKGLVSLQMLITPSLGLGQAPNIKLQHWMFSGTVVEPLYSNINSMFSMVFIQLGMFTVLRCFQLSDNQSHFHNNVMFIPSKFQYGKKEERIDFPIKPTHTIKYRNDNENSGDGEDGRQSSFHILAKRSIYLSSRFDLWGWLNIYHCHPSYR